MTDYQISQIVILLGMAGGFLGAEWRASTARKDAKAQRDANAIEAKAAREVAAEERRAATAQIIEQAKAEAEATRIKTEAIAENLKVEAQAIAESLRIQNQLSAKQIRDEQQIFREQQATVAQHLVNKVEEATVAAKDAYTEANHVNVKIENLNQRLMVEEKKPPTIAAVSALTQKAAGQIDNIEATATRIETKVDTKEKPK